MKSLKEIRKERGVSKAAITRHLGISKPCYDSYEADPSTMRIKTAKKLASFLHVDIQDIFFMDTCK